MGSIPGHNALNEGREPGKHAWIHTGTNNTMTRIQSAKKVEGPCV